MTPYYEQSGVVIYHGNCEELLDGYFAAPAHVMTDPPYGINLANHAAGRERSDRSFAIAGDEDQTLGQAVLNWAHVSSVPVVAFANPRKPWAGPWRQWLVWDKGPVVGGGGDTATLWKLSWELIQVSGRKKRGPRDSSVLNYWVTPQLSAVHPAAKPEALMAYLVYCLTDNDDMILDPFMGRGTTLVAAKRLGRKAVGIEIDERYCEIAAKRLQQEVLPLVTRTWVVGDLEEGCE
jgi:site-specific DNA-methyltransferase (adenine-specific)